MNNKKQFYIGLVIAILNVLAIINGMFYFFGMAGFTITEWFFFNICAPSTAIFLTGFFFRKTWLMAAAIPFMGFFGFGGLFFFGWNGTALIAQAGHILMTAAIIYTIFTAITDHKNLRASAAGLIAGIILFAIFIPVHQDYIRNRPDLIKKLGDPVFEEKIKSGRR